MDILDKFAEQAHISWSGWMKYLFTKSKINEDGTVTIPKWAVDRWTRQMNTDYDDLSEKEQESDIHEAKQYLKILKQNI